MISISNLFRHLSTAFIFALAIGVSVPVAAQVATAKVSAITIRPLSVVKTADLDFGNMIAPTANATMTVNTADGSISTTGALIRAGGTPSRANFIVFGGPIQIINVSIPTSITLKRTAGGNTQLDKMTLDQMAIGNGNRNFGTNVRGLLGVTGIYNLTVGGRLNVKAGQKIGTYAGTFNMTVIYE